MTLFDFKGGVGTASRIVQADLKGAPPYTVGVHTQCNFGTMRDLIVAGVPVGTYFDPQRARPKRKHDGSVIVVIATDAPLLPHHLKRLARRATLGLARVGSIAEDTSGDLFVAFSTAPLQKAEREVATQTFNALFEGVVLATEEAVINALVAAETISKRYPAIDIARLRRYLRKHGRLVE
jgi:L-aminopeptidase/D-esterase-like protein